MKRVKRLRRALSALNYDLFRVKDLTPPAPATIHSKILEAATARIEIKSEPISLLSKDLPDEAELTRRFDIYNWQYYLGRLSRPRIVYSKRMKAAGSYSPSEKLIKIGRAYHEVFPEEINLTLKHEMIHILHIKHDRQFKAEARRLGTSLKAKYHLSLIRPPKYVYACPGCQKEYPRQKRLVMASCWDCSPRGRFDKRFKLVLIGSAGRKSNN